MGRRAKRLSHGALVFASPHTALAQVGLAALDAGDEVWMQVGRGFEVISETILKLHGLLGRQLPHLGFNGFKLAQGGSGAGR